jgi:hypothetical protein
MRHARGPAIVRNPTIPDRTVLAVLDIGSVSIRELNNRACESAISTTLGPKRSKPGLYSDKPLHCAKDL